MQKDYYELLGVDRTATEEEIGKAYRQRAVKLHPDVNSDPQATEEFKRVAEAFEVLSDGRKRQEYDHFGTVGGSKPSQYGVHINPFDMFSDLFGDRRGPIKGADIYQELHISLREAYEGCQKVTYSIAHVSCKVCDGSGAKAWVSCYLCGGAGKINTQQGPFAISMTCTKCWGCGRLPQALCEECGGTGRVEDSRQEHTLKIPSGVETGVQLMIRGQGESTRQGIPGDLIYTIIIDPHTFYEREGHNLYCVVPITFAQSVKGHEMLLPLVSGEQCVVKVPSRTKSGQVLRLKGKGMPVAVASYRQKVLFGDLLIRVQVEVPEKPSQDYLALVEQLSSLDKKETYERIAKFETRIGDLPKAKENVL
jgi:molecular chaperone DnaJ